jgi:hypothetical protein
VLRTRDIAPSVTSDAIGTVAVAQAVLPDYGPTVDVEQIPSHGTAKFDATSPAALAAGAIVLEIVIAVVPWLSGESYVSVALSDGPPVVRFSNLLMLFAGVIAIVVAISQLRRRPVFAAGMFVATAVVLGVQVIARLLATTQGWIWQTFAILGLQAVETLLLFLAASRARREEPSAAT